MKKQDGIKRLSIRLDKETQDNIKKFGKYYYGPSINNAIRLALRDALRYHKLIDELQKKVTVIYTIPKELAQRY